jgi:hypothetical protein
MNPTFHRLQCEIAHSLEGLDASQTQLRPRSHPDSLNSEKWSIQQIMEHLLLTYTATETVLEARLAKRAPTQAKPSLMQRVMQCAVFRIGYFPRSRQAPSPVIPPASASPLSGEELAQAATQHLTRLARICTEAGELFGTSQPCASHMILGPLSIDRWRRFHMIHGRHHLRQIDAIRKTHNFQP